MTSQEFLQAIESGEDVISSQTCSKERVRVINEAFFDAAYQNEIETHMEGKVRTFQLAVRQYFTLSKGVYPNTCSEYVRGVTKCASNLLKKGG